MNDSIGTPILSVNWYSNVIPQDNIGMSIGTRIREARLAAKLTQKELAHRVGMKQGTLSALETGGSQSSTLLPSMAAALGVSALWLETGKGQMDAGAPDTSSGLSPGSFMRVEAVEPGDPRLTIIPKVRLRLTAGLSGFEVEPEPYDGGSTTVPTDWLERRGYSRDKLIAVTVRGESMEPTFCEGDLVVINTADTQPVAGAVYAVNYEGEPAIKRLARDAGRWWLVSDNSDQRKYYRQSFQNDTSQIIGRVVRKETERF